MSEPASPTGEGAEPDKEAEHQRAAREALGTDWPSGETERNNDTSGGDDEIVSPT